MKNSFLKIAVFVTALTTVLFYSCSTSLLDGYKQTESGLRYKFIVHGTDTLHPQYGQVVRIKMIKRINDSIVENTNQVNPEGIQQLLREPLFKGAIEEGIRMMVIGDSVSFLVSSDSINKYFILKDSTRQFKANTLIAFDLMLTNIQPIEDARWEAKQKK